MKLALAVLMLVAFTCNSTFADGDGDDATYPTKGDHVFFEGTSWHKEYSPQQEPMRRETETLTLVDISPSKDQLRVYRRQKEFSGTCPDGCGAISNRWQKPRKYETRKEVLEVLSNCSKYGVPEAVKVPAGPFQTCRTTYDETIPEKKIVYHFTNWVADVPFGSVKKETKMELNGVLDYVDEQELSEVVWGVETQNWY